MTINYNISKLIIKNFRGIDALELVFRAGFPSVLIGSNNAGKSTVLNAIALALNGGGYYQWSPTETDFFCNDKGERAKEFLVQLQFHSNEANGYPAVKGVGKPTLIHGVQVKGKMTNDGRASHRRTLIDSEGKSVTLAPRTTMSKADKEMFAEHNIGFTQVNAKLDDIYEHTPEVWFFKPQNIEASLYIWKTGPIAKLSKLMASKFLISPWVFKLANGSERKMPDAIVAGHNFFRQAVDAFPFWKDEMKPVLERVFARYVGTNAQIDLRPDTQALEDWLAQQLAVSLATDPESVPTPLRSMGDGWQSVIRLAALEALSEFPDLMKDRVVLLLEEPETHLHPHLRRKLRKVLGGLSDKGWTIVYTTHSSEFVSFDGDQLITRLVRSKNKINSKSLHTDGIDNSAKLQSKLDERGAHDFLFSTCVVFCEGKDDAFALKVGFEKSGLDCDARSVSLTQCGSVTAIPSFVSIASALGIRWCAVTDEDRLPDGTIKPQTQKSREIIDTALTDMDIQVAWPGDLEASLGVVSGKATPAVTLVKLTDVAWKTQYPDFDTALSKISNWIVPVPAA